MSKTVYVVVWNFWDEWHVTAVFQDQSAAKEFIKKQSTPTDYTIEEADLH